MVSSLTALSTPLGVLAPFFVVAMDDLSEQWRAAVVSGAKTWIQEVDLKPLDRAAQVIVGVFKVEWVSYSAAREATVVATVACSRRRSEKHASYEAGLRQECLHMPQIAIRRSTRQQEHAANIFGEDSYV